MDHFREVFPHCILKYLAKIKKICEPLQQFLGISLFSYARIEPDGTFINFTNCPDELEIYYQRKMYLLDPYLSHPSLLRPGIVYIPQAFNAPYMQAILDHTKVQTLLFIFYRVQDRSEGFFFGTRQHEKVDSRCLLNSYDLLQTFISYFQREAKKIIEEAQREGFNIKKEKGAAFLAEGIQCPLWKNNPQIQRFLKLTTPLTERERECLDLFKQGNSARVTAAILGLSCRTVEFYFDNIKNKLNCYSKTDLLQW